MCMCNPNIRTPYCGKDNCKWPKDNVVENSDTETPKPEKDTTVYDLLPNDKNVAMYIFLNKGLHMSTGKAAAQAAHAAVEAYRISKKEDELNPLLESWYEGGHYTKLVLEARDESHLYTIQEYLNERGFKTRLIIDEGMTEIDAHQATALGVELVDRNDLHTKKTFSAFSLYKDTIRFSVEIDR